MKLFDYQEKIYEKIKDKQSVALFMEPGTGKTVLSLTKFANSKSNRLFIICLASKIKEWETDLIDFYGEVDYCSLTKGYKKNKELLIDNHNVYLVSFQSLLNIKDEVYKILNDNWTIIIDESQYIKNHKSKISKLCHRLGTKTNNKMILTGTPQNKGYIDYYSQLKFLGVFTTIASFMANFCITQKISYGRGPSFTEIVGYQHKEELDNIIASNSVFYKRNRNNNELPTQKYIDFDRNRFYKTFIKDRVYEDVICPNAGVLRLRLRQLCGGSLNQYRFKSDKEEWVKDFIENTYTRIVIFYNFNEECAILKEIVDKTGRPVSIYNGTEKDITNFETQNDAVLLVNYKSGGTGVNWLKRAYIAIFYSPPESYLEFEQARKRLDRIGQENIPMFYCLRTKDTVETKIYQSIEQKEDFDNAKFLNYLKGEGINDIFTQ